MKRSNFKKRFFRLFFAGLIIASIVYLSLALMVYAKQESILFHGRPVSSQMKKVHAKLAVERNGAEGMLRGWHIRPKARKLILYFGGNAEELSYLVDEFRAYSEYSVLLLNYRGYGASDGNPSELGFFSDALAIYDSQAAHYDQIFVIGRSLGTGVATYLTSMRPVAAVALITPFDSITETAQDAIGWLPMKWLVKHPFNSLQFAKGITTPALFIVAEKDEVIGMQRSERLFNAWKGEKKWILRMRQRHNSYSVGLHGGGEIYLFFQQK